MIRHLIKIIWNQRKKNGWIAAELLLVFVVLWFLTDLLFVTGTVYFSPQGYSIDHVYLVNIGMEENENGTGPDTTGNKLSVGESTLLLFDRIKTCPGVEAVCAGEAAMPYDGNNRYNSLFIISDTIQSKNFKSVTVTPEYMDIFGFKPGKEEKKSWDEMLAGGQVILSGDLFTEIKELGGSRNKPLYRSSEGGAENEIRVGGVTEPFRGTRFNKKALWMFSELTRDDIIQANNPYYTSIKIAIRVKPEADRDFESFFIKNMEKQLSVGPFYLIDLTSFKDKRDAYELLTGEKRETQNAIAITVFLFFNIFLGIFGTFWFRTERRKEEMGLRIAVGSTPGGLKRLMTGEGLVLLTLVAIPGIILCLNLQLLEVTNGYYMDYTASRFLIGIALTYLLIAGMIVLGIWYPAHQTMKMKPAEALHYE
ncbi:ABC transporter permease [Parabacteroides sp. Marseille-P3160]|uniref:ABC transporter permease n=1 Tax=Parabacteroides sp. Marseille-P3160 TaxID=1917887 RepID=UPI0009BBE7B0|nr:ABC transporter permease [Parabacteroides sp. Marseille-P3160]